MNGKYIRLRELVTGEVKQVVCPAGYDGLAGELWYARIFDWPFANDGVDYSVVVTTPYVLIDTINGYQISPEIKSEWLAYFERMRFKSGIANPVESYRHLMKYGLGKNYWNEFVFLAYVNFKPEMILLTGLPDKPKTLPHSEENKDRFR